MGARCYAGKQKYPHLFEPIRIGNIRLKNRIIAAPTSPSMMTTEGHFTPEMIAYLEEKAKGGAAVVTYGEAIVHSATGKSHNKQLQLDSFGVDMDPSHIHRAGEKPEDALASVVSRMGHVHIRDCKGPGPSPGAPAEQACGRGEINLYGYFKALVDAAYEGPVCLEVIGPEQTLQQAQAIASESYGYMNAILKMLGGR
jgi:sugar phosphate isomerase/epimerase